ncbi:MAG: hypothetical protein ACYC75_03510 [Minisyncoccota bacterium]
MTWPKASLVLALSVIFDALRFMFSQFWFFGPAFAAIYCATKLSGAVSTLTFGLLGAKSAAAVCASGAVAGGIAGVEVIEAFGAVMAMAIGLAGWMTIGLVLLMTNVRIFKANAGNAFWFVASLGVSEIPFINALPMLTVTVWRMYAAQIKKEKAALRKYEKEQAQIQQQGREQQVAELMQFRNMQLAQDAQLAQVEAQESANEDQYEEIPREVREAA